MKKETFFVIVEGNTISLCVKIWRYSVSQQELVITDATLEFSVFYPEDELYEDKKETCKSKYQKLADNLNNILRIQQ